MRVSFGLVTLVLSALAASPAWAHAVGISRGDYRLEGNRVEADITFARLEILGAFPDVDADHDGSISQRESQGARPAIEASIVQGLGVAEGSGRCSGSLEDVALSEQDGLTVHAIYRCPGPPADVSITADFLDSLSPGHRHLVTGRSGQTVVHAVLFRGSRGFHLTHMSGGGPHADTSSMTSAITSLFRLGVKHTLTGYDHLLFLVGLILVGGRMRSLLAALLAFAVAHSITLATAGLGVWAPPSRIVGPMIALTIAYVGVENCFIQDAKYRWLITFPFGLIHGFGFAGALAGIELSKDQLLPALASFNIGVEAGQVAFLLIALPALLWLRKQPWFGARGARVVSAGIALAGVCWFIARVR